MSSTAPGSQDSASSVAAMASATDVKWPTANTVFLGLGTSPTTASVAITSVPSEPTTNFARSKGVPSARRSSR